MRTDAKITATEKAKASMQHADEKDRAAAISVLQKAGKPVTDEAISDQMYQTFYNREFAKTQQGTGGSVQRAITATTAAVQALAGGDLKSAIAGGAAPYLANEIARLIPETDWQARVLAHAVVNAALAAASKKDVATAAAGAATGELAGIIAVDAYHKTVGELSEEEKQTVSALATLASGLAGGLVGDSSASVVAAAQAGKTTVENNALASRDLGNCRTMSAEACGKAKELSQKILDKNLPSVEDMRDKLAACQDDSCKQTVWQEYRQASDKTIETLKQMALDGELSREELAFINHDLAKELAFGGRVDNDKVGRSEYMSWLGNGGGPLSGFFNAELREKELVNQGFSSEDAAQKVKEDQRNMMLIETAMGVIGSKAGNNSSGKVNANQVVTKNVNPSSLISRQNSNEMSGSQVKRIAKDMKANGYKIDEPVDVAIVNGKMIIIDGHHRAEAAKKAGIKDIPVRVHPVTKEQGDQLLREAAEARVRY